MNYKNFNKKDKSGEHDLNADNPRVERMGAATKKGIKIRRTVKKTSRIFGGVFGSVFKVVFSIVLVATIICCIVGTALTIYIMQYVRSAPEIDLNALKLNFTSSVYGKDDNGDYIQIQTLRYDMDRIWVDLKDIPKSVQDAFVYSEDERFYTHSGVDFVRTAAAAVNEALRLFGGSDADQFGASTITQQLIKNINGDFLNRTYGVKLKEILMAMNLEYNYSKDQILELYLNYVGLHAASGVQAASNYYYGKNVEDINYVEAAALATITKNPTNLNPEYHPEENKSRRELFALAKMVEFGTITQAEYDAALTTELNIVGSTGSVTDESGTVNKSVQSYYVDALIEEVIDDLVVQYNYSRSYAEQLLYTSGYQIYSNMEISTQNILEGYFEDLTTFETTQLGGADPPEASMVIADLNGNIVALTGGIGEKTAARNFNRATMAYRPAGSTIKPIAVYVPAMEQNIINWSTILDDNPITITNSDGSTRSDYPQNYNKTYQGNMTMIEALKVSKNTIPVKLSELMTPRVLFDYVQDSLGLNSLKDPDNVNTASMALGDGGVILTELTNAFQIFGNGGTFTEGKLYSKVTDAEGKKVVLNAETRDTTRVLESDTAYVMNKALWRAANEYGGSGRGSAIDGFETIGKTGTSNDRKDLLFIGITPYYVAGIRYGYDDNNIVIPGTQSYQVPVWQTIMTAVHEGKNPADFELNDKDTMQLTYCSSTGMVATYACPGTAQGYYRISNLPATCYYHVNNVSTESDTSEDATQDTSQETSQDIPSADIPEGAIVQE